MVVAGKERVYLVVRASIDGEVTEHVYDASYASNGSVDVLIYEEDLQELGNVRNFITIQPDKVNMKRSGGIVMNQQFLAGKRTESVYHHPFGSIHLEITTKDIRIGKRSVDVFYDSVMNGTEKQSHHLQFRYMKENE